MVNGSEETPSPDRLAKARTRLVERDLSARGVTDERVLAAMASVRRERFVPADMVEFAYEDSPLPIGSGQTISQPFIVALMAEAAEIGPSDRVLEVGTGSGYGAAVLAHLAAEVWTIERHDDLAETARRRLEGEGIDNVKVLVGDGTLGWPEEAPFDAIVVTASGPVVPQALREQLTDGGRLVLPSGPDGRGQALLRVRRVDGDYQTDDLGPVRFVPLIGAQGWEPNAVGSTEASTHPGSAWSGIGAGRGLPRLVSEGSQPFADFDEAPVDEFLDRVGDAAVVLLGEASHGTAEFYRMRDVLTRALVTRKGFGAVAVEADWPDAAVIDSYIRSRVPSPHRFVPFGRFPTWMWRNREVSTFVSWLRAHNDTIADPALRVSFHGLDIYSLFTSRDAVLTYLDGVDPAAAAVARRRYSCLSPWEQDPAAYGRAVVTGALRSCEAGVVATLTDLLQQRLAYAAASDDEGFVDAAQNALVVADAERYYRVMYLGSRESWNLRDQHMFETLQLVRSYRRPGTKVVVWEHNSHVGDASATEMGARGEHNVGMLARHAFGDDAYLVGFGTDHGTVAAATNWGGPMERKAVRPAHPESYERVFHETGIGAFVLPLRHPINDEVQPALVQPKLERAIGVIYRPETELQSHYFQASLPNQFDDYVWFDATTAVSPLPAQPSAGERDTFPFGV